MIALFTLALVVRLIYLIVISGLNAPFDGDEIEYHNFATSLSENGEWGTDSARATRPPVTPFLISMVYLVTGPDPTAARVLGVVISSLVPGMLYIVGMLFTRNRRVVLLAAFAFALYPPAIFYAPMILTENLTSLLVITSLGSYLWASQKRTALSAIATGVIWTILGLNRSVFILTPIAFLIIQLIVARFGTQDWIWSRKMWLIGIAAFVITLSPWIIRNAVILDSFVPTTTRSGHLLLMTNGTLDNEEIKSGQYFKNPELFTFDGTGKNEVEIDAIKRNRALDELSENWTQLPQPLFNRAKNFWTFRPDPYDPSLTRNDVIMSVIWIPVLLFFFLSSFVRSWKRNWPLLTFILLAFVLTLPFWGTPRFRFPVDSLLILGASTGLAEIIRMAQSRFHVLSWPAKYLDDR
ncbi:MAG: glycosyltransferase family 39 protein [Dehalococcoidia bacterium]